MRRFCSMLMCLSLLVSTSGGALRRERERESDRDRLPAGSLSSPAPSAGTAAKAAATNEAPNATPSPNIERTNKTDAATAAKPTTAPAKNGEDKGKKNEKKSDPLPELLAKHLAALGGEEKIEGLTALSATGRISIGQRTLPFKLFAQTPNRVRTEIQSSGHLVVQAFDGKNQPWQLNEQDEAAVPTAMTGEAAREFVADAEFWDPLVQPAKRGIKVEYKGEIKVAERPYHHLLVLRPVDGITEVLLDPTTHLIARQVRRRRIAGGREIAVETRFDDFRRVAGVLLPHRISVHAQGRKLHETELEDVTANPELKLLLFNQSAQEK